MSRLRILHVGKFYPPVSGGMEKVVQVLCEGERQIVDSQVLVANDRPGTVQEIVNDVPVTRVGTAKKVGSVAICPSFPRWMRRLAADADVMLIHEPNPVALVAHALVRPRARLVIWLHAEVIRPQWRYKTFYRPFLRRILRRADRIVVAAPPIAESAEELQPYRDKWAVIPFGIDPDMHAATPAIAARAQAIKAESTLPLALFVGRMVPYKGIDVFLRALVGSGVRAILAGEGPLKESWRQLATELGLSDRVRFAGSVTADELAALYHACDMFVLPSVTRAEAFGMVQVEAMACSKPVISTALPSGVPWVNQDGVSGLVVPPGDDAALRQAIDTLARDAVLRERLGAGGRARVVSEFTIKRMVEQTTTLYRTLANSAPHDNRQPVEHRVGVS